jgi:hypothetical protein
MTRTFNADLYVIAFLFRVSNRFRLILSAGDASLAPLTTREIGFQYRVGGDLVSLWHDDLERWRVGSAQFLHADKFRHLERGNKFPFRRMSKLTKGG